MTVDRPIAIALILFAILLLVFFLAYPEYQKFKSLQLELGQKRAEFNAEYDYFSTITKSYYDIQNHSDDIKKIDDALPSSSNFGPLIYFFQNKAMENGLMLKSLFLSSSSPAGLAANVGVKDIVFSLNLSGDYPALENFIRALENSVRLFEITSVSFGLSSAASGPQSQTQTQFQTQQVYSFSLEVKTHSY